MQNFVLSLLLLGFLPFVHNAHAVIVLFISCHASIKTEIGDCSSSFLFEVNMLLYVQ